MAQSASQLKASKKYHEKLDSLVLRVPKGEKEVIQAHAQEQGQSVNAFLARAVTETMERDHLKKT